jgi:periplasmic protein TonB
LLFAKRLNQYSPQKFFLKLLGCFYGISSAFVSYKQSTTIQNLETMKTKNAKADIEGKKSIFFQIGLVVSLSIALAAFEWPSKADMNFTLPIGKSWEIPEEVIPITDPVEIKTPPPPVLTPDFIIIHDDSSVDIIENPDIFADIKSEDLPNLIRYKIDDEPDVDETIPFVLVEEKPTFMGGDFNTFSLWVAKRIIYPEAAAQNYIQGRVLIQFIIDTDGSVTNVKVIRGVDKLLDDEAVRVVSSSPKWTPGKQRGKPTRVVFNFPVFFGLK